MSVLSGELIRQMGIITPFNERIEIQRDSRTLSYGVSAAGYDVRIEFDSDRRKQTHLLTDGDFLLASTVEHFTMPNNVIGVVHDKSSWARLGLQVQNTVIEPGWKGFLTLELTFHAGENQLLRLHLDDPIAQIVFHEVQGSVIPYNGKYQNQKRGPQNAR